MPSLFSPHPLVLETAYSELKRQALEQPSVLVGTPGSVSERDVDGRAFLYRQFYDAEGKKKAEYLGALGEPEAMSRAAALRDQIASTNGLLEQARLLARQGYVRVDARTGAVVAAVANHGLFRGGVVLIGSHAFGALQNDLGIRSAAFLTEDVGIARRTRLELTGTHRFEDVLRESTVPLSPIPGFDRKLPPTSYKTPGRGGLRVDLLMPGRGREVTVRAVPELHAFATALPHLDYLLLDPIDGILLGRESVVPIKLPRPERFAWHKMLVSQLRNTTSEKRTKDVHQAAVLFALLSERDPAALTEAFVDVPLKTKTRAGALQVLRLLEASAYDRAIDLLRAQV
jgi:hypothetical protein